MQTMQPVDTQSLAIRTFVDSLIGTYILSAWKQAGRIEKRNSSPSRVGWPEKSKHHDEIPSRRCRGSESDTA